MAATPQEQIVFLVASIEIFELLKICLMCDLVYNLPWDVQLPRMSGLVSNGLAEVARLKQS